MQSRKLSIDVEIELRSGLEKLTKMQKKLFAINKNCQKLWKNLTKVARKL